MLGSSDGKHGGVYVEYVSLIVSCYSLPWEGNCIWGGGALLKKFSRPQIFLGYI